MTEFLSVPPKKPTDVDLVKSLKNLISSHYSTSDNPNSHNNAIEEFSKLRTQAVWKVYDKYEHSLEIVYRYYDELVSLDSKLSGSVPQIPFKYKDAFDRGSLFSGRASLTLSSFKYEIVCVLFNIGSLQSAVACNQSLESDDTLKLAAKLFQLAAGVYELIKKIVSESFQQDLTLDLHTDTLTALVNLMIAQAQEIFVLKTINDRCKGNLIAKICAQCAEMYLETNKIMQKDFIRSLIGSSWTSLVSAKIRIFQGLSEYFQSLFNKDNKEIGEEIARLQSAISHLKAGQDLVGKLLFNDYLLKATRALAEAEKDNNFIYHESVPDIKSLSPIPKSTIARITKVPNRFSSTFQDLFSDLTPIVIQQALAAYDVRKSELITVEVNKLRESTQLLNSVLTSLNLPAALEDTYGTCVPQSLIEKSNSVNQQGGIEYLQSMQLELPDLLKCCQEVLDECERMIQEEKYADDTLRSQFRDKWTRPDSEKLTKSIITNLDSYKQIIQQAVKADGEVREKFNKNRRAIELLTLGKSAIENALPRGGSSNTSRNTSAASNLKELMEEVETIKAERDTIESDLKSVTTDMKSSFLSALAHDGAINEAELSNDSLKETYGPLLQQVKGSIERQETLLANIQTQNTEFSKEKNNCVDNIHRENFLKELAAGYDAYNELVKNLDEGIKFYKNLMEHLVNFQNKINDFCFARKTEKEELLRSLTQDASRVVSSSSGPIPSTPTSTNQPSAEEVKKEPPPRPPAPIIDGSKTLPYPVMPQGMPVPYATASFGYPPPMPNIYNPYATLPFPTYPPRQFSPYPTQQYNPYPYYQQQQP